MYVERAEVLQVVALWFVPLERFVQHNPSLEVLVK